MIKCKLIKYKIKTLWLDTSFFLNIGLSSLGKKVDDRYLELKDLIGHSIRSGTLICPLSEQSDEVWVERKLFQETIRRITSGAHFRPKGVIQDFQTFSSMKAFHKKIAQIEIAADDAFFSDPIQESKRSNEIPFLIYCDSGIYPSVSDIVEKRRKIHLQFEAIRKSNIDNHVDYESQLNKELVGEINVKLNKWAEANKNLQSGDSVYERDYWSLHEIGLLIAYYSRITKKEVSFEELISYLSSDYFLSIPVNYIQSAIFANLLTGKRSIQNGDLMDSHHISTVLPYCHGILVDNRMRRIVHETKCDSLFDCKVFSMDNFEELKQFLCE